MTLLQNMYNAFQSQNKCKIDINLEHSKSLFGFIKILV